MRSHGSLVPSALCVIVCIVAGTAYSQEVTTSATVNAAIDALRDAPAFQRGEKRVDVVALGNLATEPLIAAVDARETTEDASFILNCAMALGEIKDPKASDLLVEVLGERNVPLACVAARSLGQIWEGKGPAAAEVKPVNAALLGFLHSELPEVGVYMPAMALIGINGISLDRPLSMASDELKASISEWFARNPNALPAPAQQPWQLNIYVALKGTDAAARQAATRALQQQRELGCIEPVLSAIANGETVSPDLVSLVATLTGVAFPPAGVPSDASPKEQVDRWRWVWLGALASRKDEHAVDYSLSGLEGALRRYEDDPSDETAAPVKFFRAALLSQLPGAEAVPASLSPKAKELLQDPLARKKIIADAIDELQKETGPFEKSTRLRVINTQIQERNGREVAALFLGRLHDLAYDEQNASVAGEIGDVLSQVSSIPCSLKHTQIDTRRVRLAEWLKEAQRMGFATDATAH